MQAGLWLPSVFAGCAGTILHSCVSLQGRGAPQICGRKSDQHCHLPLWGLTVLVCSPEGGEWSAET